MKVRAYVLIASVALLGMSAGSKKAKLTEGVNPGDLAPRIEFLGNDAKASFHNQLGRYTLLNFWAAYDAESRARNVQLANEVNKFGPDKIAMCSISMDEKESIFTETVNRVPTTASFPCSEECLWISVTNRALSSRCQPFRDI